MLAYTPLKQHSPYALHVGAIPGAIPPLLGWTAGTGRIDAAGVVLFGVLFLWQIPHFCAIALFRKADYARAGIDVLPNVAGELATRHTIVRWTFALVATSLLVVPLGRRPPRLSDRRDDPRRASSSRGAATACVQGTRREVGKVAVRDLDRLSGAAVRGARDRPLSRLTGTWCR